MTHSTYDTLINRFLDARWLLHETRSALGEIVERHRGETVPDAETLRELYREIDTYLATVGASGPEVAGQAS